MRLEVECPFSPGSVQVGDSVATNGVCLTANAVKAAGQGLRFWADAGPETLARTTLGRLKVQSPLNLERAMTASSRLGGHWVMGHVDAVGQIAAIRRRENAVDVRVKLEPEALRLVIPRGSVAVEGISLTVTGRDRDSFDLSMIPHSWEVTNFRHKQEGEGVNVECDVLARYVAEQLAWARQGEGADALNKAAKATSGEPGEPGDTLAAWLSY